MQTRKNEAIQKMHEMYNLVSTRSTAQKMIMLADAKIWYEYRVSESFLYDPV